MHKKIYIIGPVGSGKTTLATSLSKKYNLKYYELDKVSWDDEHGNVKRSDEEAQKIFKDIIKKDNWVIEDIGRDKFSLGRDKADIIYYIKISRLKSYYRVTKRWIKQRLGKERYNKPPKFSQWIYYISTVNSYYGKKKKNVLNNLKKYKDKVVYLKSRDVKKLINE